jgi:hypothetical protein
MIHDNIDLNHNIVLLHKLQAMLDDEKTKHGGTINPDNRDSWATAYIKAKALQNMLSQFISEVGLHLPVSRSPRRFL